MRKRATIVIRLVEESSKMANEEIEREILEDYPDLEPDDLRAALLYAHHMVAKEDIHIRTTA